MKRTLILAAALTAAGVATSMAQVYSVNAVGYVNQSIVPGFNLIANPFKNQTNTLNALLSPLLMPGNGSGVVAYRFTPGGFVVSTCDPLGDGIWLGPDGMTDVGNTENVIFGDGIFLLSPSTFTVTWVGEVEQGTPIQTPVTGGFQIKSSKVPQAGKLQSELGYPAEASDVVYKWNPVSQGYRVFTQDPLGNGTKDEWLDQDTGLPGPEPSVGIAEAVFLNSQSIKTWNRNFTVN